VVGLCLNTQLKGCQAAWAAAKRARDKAPGLIDRMSHQEIQRRKFKEEKS